MKTPSIQELESQIAIIQTHCLKEPLVQSFLATYLSTMAKSSDIFIPVKVLILILKDYIKSSEESLARSLKKAKELYEDISKQK